MPKSTKDQVIDLQIENSHFDEVIAEDFVRNAVEGSWTSETIDNRVLPIWDNDQGRVNATTEKEKIDAIVGYITTEIAKSVEHARYQIEAITSNWSDETFMNYAEGLELDLEDPSDEAAPPKP
ncbi:hypothetical protein [Sulfitobacter sp. R18_1]|uniref:hypothetical protein n=1 Tax=Sulfitobacter sp. R18_1 TaxID=2821104 RepID=UPI001ADCD565|nr:hypothetical protein [Sulfitobacter sp. R18_1]MBO9428576.1 hypothetical protein [Sulfitobacter sp. R18_1]